MRRRGARRVGEGKGREKVGRGVGGLDGEGKAGKGGRRRSKGKRRTGRVAWRRCLVKAGHWSGNTNERP